MVTLMRSGHSPQKAQRRRASADQVIPADDEHDWGRAWSLLQLMWAIDHGIELRSKRMEAALGVTISQRMVLHLLGRLPDATAGSLARLLRQHPSTLTGILRRLEREGLVRRAADPGDRRRTLLMLTRAGIALDRDKAHSLEPAIRRVLRKLDPKQLQLAAQAMEVLTRELNRR